MHRSTIIKIAIPCVFLYFIVGNIKSIIDARKSLEKIDTAKSTLAEIENTNLETLNQIDYVQSQAYLDKIALENFNMTRTEATIVILEGARTLEEVEVAKTPTKQQEHREPLTEWKAYFNL
ncbi:MAG: hypothetical protein QG570_126 [Patescibacteria group bacterium]|nr:hypothetical protein [Patescibacteria group bacterium]